ncbi:hypothetical protein EV1_035943 [Malus domestica]
MPPHVIASPALCQRCIRNALTILDINAQVRERVWPATEKYVMKVAEAAEVAGVKVFGVVAEIEVIKANIFDQQEACNYLGLNNVQK